MLGDDAIVARRSRRLRINRRLKRRQPQWHRYQGEKLCVYLQRAERKARRRCPELDLLFYGFD